MSLLNVEENERDWPTLSVLVHSKSALVTQGAALGWNLRTPSALISLDDAIPGGWKEALERKSPERTASKMLAYPAINDSISFACFGPLLVSTRGSLLVHNTSKDFRRL